MMSRFHVGTFVPVPAPDGQVCNVLGFAKCMYDGRLLEPLWVCVTDDASVIVMPLDKFTGGGG